MPPCNPNRRVGQKSFKAADKGIYRFIPHSSGGRQNDWQSEAGVLNDARRDTRCQGCRRSLGAEFEWLVRVRCERGNYIDH